MTWDLGIHGGQAPESYLRVGKNSLVTVLGRRLEASKAGAIFSARDHELRIKAERVEMREEHTQELFGQ